MLTFYKYTNHTLTPKVLLPFVVVMIGRPVEYSSADVKEFFETGVHFRVDVVNLLNLAKDRWILKGGKLIFLDCICSI